MHEKEKTETKKQITIIKSSKQLNQETTHNSTKENCKQENHPV